MIEAEKGERFGWEKGRESFGHTTLLALKMEEGVTSQRVQVACTSTSWKWQVNGISPKSLQKEHSPVDTLILGFLTSRTGR